MLCGTERGEYPHEDLKSVREVAVNLWHQLHSCFTLNRAALAGTDTPDNLISFGGLPLDLSHGTSQI